MFCYNIYFEIWASKTYVVWFMDRSCSTMSKLKAYKALYIISCKN